MLFHYKRIINTSLSKDKFLGILKKETIPYGVHSIFIRVKDFSFYNGKFEDSKFSCSPLPTKVPPYGNKCAFIPMIDGKVIMENEEGSVLEIIISGTLIYTFFYLFLNLYLILSIIAGSWTWKGIIITVSLEVAVVLYFKLVAKKTISLFEDILCERTKKD